MNKNQLQKFTNHLWDSNIIPTLQEYIKIPNKSPLFDKDWEEHGYMEQVVQLMLQWCNQNALSNMKLEVIRLPKRTPLIYIDIPGNTAKTVLLYGHMDKQPEMVGWQQGLGPWQPVLKGDKLYGRGGADDGYALFAAFSAIKALQEQNIAHPHCIIMIEASEESGSVDLPYYIEHLKSRLSKPDLVICLDSGCGNYDQLWLTTSLRGVAHGELSIKVLTEGVHSGNAGGIVPSPWLVLRQLLARLEDEKTGVILPENLKVQIPAVRSQQAHATAALLQEQVYSEYPFPTGAQPLSSDLEELILNRAWRAALTITGIEGVPSFANAGNVLLPEIKVKLSLRIPPTCDPKQAGTTIKTILETNPPFNAQVNYNALATMAGWNSPELDAALEKSILQASVDYFGKPSAFIGEGGTIPFMSMLGEKFPQAQFFITGVLGPHSNAHGPNEFLHIPTAKKLTCCVAQVLAEL